MAAAGDGNVLQTQTVKQYPSLLYVDRYRGMFPNAVQGDGTFWKPGTTPDIRNAEQLVRALAELQDQHVSLVGPKAGKTETLGVLLRSASDGSVVVWRVFDPHVTAVHAGDAVLSIMGVQAKNWLTRASALTFGGNPRSRYAEAALDIGLGTRIVHSTAGLGPVVRLRVQSPLGTAREVSLRYEPMNDARAAAMAHAVNEADLPAFIHRGWRTIGTLRIGAFAPQYDTLFNAAADRAGRKPGTTDDQAMLAGFCAETQALIQHYDSIARKSDVMVLDLRENLGGFGRLARLEASAIAPSDTPRTLDLTATSKRGIVRVTEEPVDRSCGHVSVRRPLIVLVDAGTRSAGELMTAWLWTSGARVIGEETIGAGGGLGYQSSGFPLPSGFRVNMSGSFSLFDPGHGLHDGLWSEQSIVAKVTQNRFAPSRTQPFAIQAVGMHPDRLLHSTLADLRGAWPQAGV